LGVTRRSSDPENRQALERTMAEAEAFFRYTLKNEIGPDARPAQKG